MKQKNAFPPNFIHSLDSSHMMLTCLHCARDGISFAAVHDSYWTHPVTVDIMNKVSIILGAWKLINFVRIELRSDCSTADNSLLLCTASLY